MDFSTRTVLRCFELRVPRDDSADSCEFVSFFVNRYLLAELSPYFDTICFSEQFLEAQRGWAQIEDVYSDELAVFLRYVCPNEKRHFDRVLDKSTLPTLLMLAYRFQTPCVLSDIERFFKDEVLPSQLEDWHKFALEMLLLSERYNPCSRVVINITRLLEGQGFDAKLSKKNGSLERLAPVVAPPMISSYHWDNFKYRHFYN